MPRVSDEHLERRRQQIVDAAQRCFARKGFHQTSMQDVFAESELSAGAVYRYFKSKDELVAALAASATGNVRELLAEVIHRDPIPTPAEVMTEVGGWVTSQSGAEGRLRLAPQAWSLALTNPKIAASVEEILTGIRGRWREYAERMREAQWLDRDADLDAVAAVLFAIVPGFILQHLLVGDVDTDDMARGLQALLPVHAAPDVPTPATDTGPDQR